MVAAVEMVASTVEWTGSSSLHGWEDWSKEDGCASCNGCHYVEKLQQRGRLVATLMELEPGGCTGSWGCLGVANSNAGWNCWAWMAVGWSNGDERITLKTLEWLPLEEAKGGWRESFVVAARRLVAVSLFCWKLQPRLLLRGWRAV